MKTRRILVVMALILILAMPAYAQQNATFVKSSIITNVNLQSGNTAREDGKKFATDEAARAAKLDRMEGKVRDYKRRFPTRNELIARYRLNNYGDSYKNNFIEGYKQGFRETYDKEYYTLDVVEVNSESPSELGNQIGTSDGAVMLAKDLVRRLNKNWIRAYNEFVTEASLKDRYNLYMETQEYIDSFILGYREGFRKSYLDNYYSTKSEIMKNNVNYVYIGRNGGEIDHSSSAITVKQASVGSESIDGLKVVFPENSVLKPTYMGLASLNYSKLEEQTDLLSLTKPYEIIVGSDNKEVKLYKDASLQFDYNSGSKGGIYKWDGFKWLYQYTTLKDNIAEIPLKKGIYKGGIYGLFIDEMYNFPKDAGFHKLRQSIVVAYRRHYVPQYNYFNPESYMTKLQYADILYNALRYKTQYIEKPRYIENYKDIKGYEKQVQFALALGYLKLNDNNIFDADSKITYSDLDIFVKKQINFSQSYSNIANLMKKEYFYRSKFYDSPNNYAKKAEVIFTVVEAMD